MTDPTLDRSHELCPAMGALRDAFRRLVHRGQLLPLRTISTVRDDVVTFCRVAHGQGVCGIEVRRQVRRAIRDVLTTAGYLEAIDAGEQAATSIVDEIYLLGEHRS